MKTAVKRVKTPAFQRVRLSCIADNLVKSGNLERYYNLLADFNFIYEKINYPGFGVQALIEDYDLIEKNLIDDQELLNHPEYNPEKIKILKLIQGALRLSAHILNQDKTQLAGQLLGRLLFFENPRIQLLLQQIKNSKSFPWLRPLIASLTPPGGGLLRTFTGHNDCVNAVIISRDGKRLISASSDKTLKLWDLETGSETRTFIGHSDWVRAVAMSADGKRFISASADQTLKLWDVETGSEIRTFSGHSFWVLAVAISGDNKRVISASGDKTLKLWNLETGEVIATFSGDVSILSCAFTPDDLTIVAGDTLGRLHFLSLEGMIDNL